MNPRVLAVSLLLCSCGLSEVDLSQSDALATSGSALTAHMYGARGDGIADDGPAIAAALAAAAAQGQPLILGPRVFRVGRSVGRWHYFSVKNKAGFAIEGNGATLLFDDQSLALLLDGCGNVKVRNLTIDHRPLPFTQGEVKLVHPDGAVELLVDADYPLPYTYDSLETDTNLKRPPNVIVMKADGSSRKRSTTRSHYEAQLIRALGGRRFRLELPAGAGIAAGDRLVVVRSLTRKIDDQGPRGSDVPAGDVVVTRSTGPVTFENVTMLAAADKAFRVHDNAAKVSFVRLVITRHAGALASVVRDGIHAKNNRAAVSVTASTIEGVLDDDINVTSLPYVVRAVTGAAWKLVSKESDVYCYPIRPGDSLQVLDLARGTLPELLEVATASPQTCPDPGTPLVQTVTFVRAPTTAPAIGGETVLFDLTAANDGFVVSGSTLRPLVNRAISATGANGTITGNTIDSRGGAGIWIANWPSVGAGPMAVGAIVHGNTVKGATLAAFKAGLLWEPPVTAPPKPAIDLTLDHNHFEALDGDAIEISGAREITMTANTASVAGSTPARFHAVHLSTVGQVNAAGLRVIDPRPGATGGVVIDGASPVAGIELGAPVCTVAAGVPCVWPAAYQ